MIKNVVFVFMCGQLEDQKKSKQRKQGISQRYVKKKSWLFPLLPVACWSAPSTSRLCRGHFADSPSLTLGTILSAVDGFIWSPKTAHAAFELAVQAANHAVCPHSTSCLSPCPHTRARSVTPPTSPQPHTHTTGVDRDTALGRERKRHKIRQNDASNAPRKRR